LDTKKQQKQKPRKSRLLSSKGEKWDRIINRGELKIAEIKTAEIQECLHLQWSHEKVVINCRLGPFEKDSADEFWSNLNSAVSIFS
jgi:hypothetical protein